MAWEGEAHAEPSCRVYRDYLMACRHSLLADFGVFCRLDESEMTTTV